jgi:hypothetical protein
MIKISMTTIETDITYKLLSNKKELINFKF